MIPHGGNQHRPETVGAQAWPYACTTWRAPRRRRTSEPCGLVGSKVGLWNMGNGKNIFIGYYGETISYIYYIYIHIHRSNNMRLYSILHVKLNTGYRKNYVVYQRIINYFMNKTPFQQ